MAEVMGIKHEHPPSQSYGGTGEHEHERNRPATNCGKRLVAHSELSTVITTSRSSKGT